MGGWVGGGLSEPPEPLLDPSLHNLFNTGIQVEFILFYNK